MVVQVVVEMERKRWLCLYKWSSGTGGGGGGGSGGGGSGYNGGNGGSGVVVVRYQIAQIASAKATGGTISFFGGKTIHTFTGAGDFN